MADPKEAIPPAPHEPDLRARGERLDLLRAHLLDSQGRFAADVRAAAPHHRESAKNLVHYLALRGHDLRDLQRQLGELAQDVHALQAALAKQGAPHLGVVLKIETRRGFEQLPRILLSALRLPRVGVMIARGDLAVECGFERLAEVQEEIRWVSEAAHVPVTWATQVLETLAPKGVPSRAEINDAAMGERAECVMLNKGPHVVEAVRMLDGILRRMAAHMEKKTPTLRRLRSLKLT